MGKLGAYVEISRPKNALMSILGTLTGWVNSTSVYDGRLILACLIPPLVLMAGNAINDYYDAEIDAINKPYRPIPSGRISKREALNIYIALSLFGIALSIFLGFIEFLIVTAFSLSWYAYARWLKRTGVPGNALVSLGVAFTLIFGSLAAGNLTNKVIIFSSVAFTSNLIREFVKAVEDLPGDRAHGVRTIAVRIGVKRTGILVFLLSLATVVLTILPVIFRLTGIIYLSLSVIISLPILMLASAICLKGKLEERARETSSLIKVSMFLGLLGMLLDPFRVV
ncbi:geranylgeranylglycerol-phosphate geranylgeranyltransferase [Candidatus Korarchaeum cryptofilum]|jgi:geranylgeranylglycerol-phosphate geranylgeranyltransferase|uniref:Digeranylgeranylglyceryl phosphate synthase n=1 Tax=Korarchaeum cryptofilum (strain OPF8) TaxID=374847 RepID=DGGGP_KORCO|nr:geranylgeranylglycerol-phosphate geranylgeranyltransferase [Candidatus Korarchaeum cryptofilum]B1L6Z7.1 RecName: Full=Digeranylgeranylglyceryl phosphate synthase; Short=DGGGP synthase; Short=DGGGPS; AltName: Full=(S)-2,3-di-O-geranylgeranylglyceryl phosphate synthase; AltName: Full=Geranylgeranylglycerol-phosphate geranylgeranyltransferase [Candidatus Korarchaeum cryptofilum OPF8]ACB08226.1 UbiA prenyltransferase [Candidatus Korarchaeum cryptofilum OPF8]